METKTLDAKHIKLQFLMMFISLLAFLTLATSVGSIVWLTDFRSFIVLISGVFALFIGIIALLRYYTQREQLTFLFLGAGFLGVGLLDIVQLLFESNGFDFLFTSSGQGYTLTSMLSKGFLSLLVFLSWFISRKRSEYVREQEIIRKEKAVMFTVSTIFTLFIGTLTVLVLLNIIVESVVVVTLGVFSLLLLVLSLLGYIFRKGWEHSNLDFWIIFSISFLILSQILYLPFLNLEYFNMVNLSVWAQFIAYIALLTGFLNSIYELYEREREIQRELSLKNKILDGAKKKIEEAYLVTRKEKWNLVEKEKTSKLKNKAK
ncbi:MAG: hypothetical protein AB9915_01720 [Candidatus Dojkabacteria bacterium]